jgi:hypothetical protein
MLQRTLINYFLPQNIQLYALGFAITDVVRNGPESIKTYHQIRVFVTLKKLKRKY